MIPFNRQNIFGNELEYIRDAYASGKISGDGKHSRWCSAFMEEKFGAPKVLLTTSGTHALEMAMMIIGVGEHDEVIVPSYTFVSTANAIVLRGAKPVFAEIREDTMNMDENRLEELITPKTKAIMPVHYAGVGCEMDAIMEIAEKHDLWVIEDAAQGVNSRYKDRYLGTIGHIGCYSFHETKNYSMGEGGAIVINDEQFIERAEIIREKGTNRSKFFRGEVDKYTWIEIGSSFLPSEINAAVLRAQLEQFDAIQHKRDQVFTAYHRGLKSLEEEGHLRRPVIPGHCRGNSHMYYILTGSLEERSNLISYLKEHQVLSVFHYVPLHSSPYAREHFEQVELPVTESVSQRLLRLPMFYSLELDEVEYIVDHIIEFYSI